MAETQWLKIQNKKGTNARILIDGLISPWRNASKDFYAMVDDFENDGVKIVHIDINSGGGSVIEGIAIINRMQESDIQFHTKVIGIAASMAGVIAVSGDTSEISRYGKLMTHEVTAGTHGNSQKLRDMADQIDDWANDLAKLLAEKTGKPVEKVKAKFFKPGVDKWMNASTAVKERLIDKVVEGPKMKNQLPQGFENLDIEASYEFYNNNIQTFDPVTAKVERFQLPKKEQNNSNNKNSNMELQLIAKALGLDSASTEQEILAKVNELAAKNLESEQKLKKLEKEVKATKASRIKDLIDNAVSAKKITEKQGEQYQKLAEMDFETVVSILGELPANDGNTGNSPNPTGKAQSIAEILQKAKNDNGGNPTNERADWDFDKWTQEDPDGLKAMSNEDPDKFKKILQAQYPDATTIGGIAI